jgi:hypothetical protein
MTMNPYCGHEECNATDCALAAAAMLPDCEHGATLVVDDVCIFSVHPTGDGGAWIGNTVCNTAEMLSWLGVEVGPARMLLIRSGDVDLRDAFEHAESGRVLEYIHRQGAAPTVGWRDVATLGEYDLMERGMTLPGFIARFPHIRALLAAKPAEA